MKDTQLRIKHIVSTIQWEIKEVAKMAKRRDWQPQVYKTSKDLILKRLNKSLKEYLSKETFVKSYDVLYQRYFYKYLVNIKFLSGEKITLELNVDW